MKILEIEDLANYVDVYDIPNDWIQYYDLALNTFDEKWLEVDFSKILDFYNLDSDFKRVFLEEINVLKNDINLNFLVYLWYFIIFKSNDDYKISKWNTEFSYFKSHGSFMMLSVSLVMGYSVHKNVMEKYDAYQIDIHKENIRLALTSDRDILGINGIRFSQMIWGSRFMKGHIIQVGSLQYELKKRYLEQEDVIFIHIPRNTKLDYESIQDSFRKAPQYVNKYLSTNNLKYVTSSWLLSPELKNILSSDSNIMKFQDCFNLIGVEENTKDFLNFVFNAPLFEGDYEALTSDTTLQKGIKNKLLNKEKLHIGIGILK